MHEASLVAELIQVVETQAAEHGMTRVTGLKLRVGAMRAAVPELLKTAFEVMRVGTVAEAAALEIETVPLVARCENCRQDVTIEEFAFFCPICGSVLSKILSGQEMDLMELTGEGGEPS
jgi:hydrogenase nickel incorporation protein HypA/HybF